MVNNMNRKLAAGFFYGVSFALLVFAVIVAQTVTTVGMMLFPVLACLLTGMAFDPTFSTVRKESAVRN